MVNGDNLVKALAAELNVTGYVQRVANGVPDSVEAVAQVFDNQFRQTARVLYERGNALIARGNQLIAMSREIDEAANHVPENLRQWVNKEIDYREIAQSYSLINPEE